MLITLAGAAISQCTAMLLCPSLPVKTGSTVMVRKKGNRVHLDIYLDPEKHEQLQRLSELTRVPQAAYLREALDGLLKKYTGTLRKATK